MLSFLHDVFHTLFNLFGSFFGMPSPVDARGHTGNDGNEIIYQVMVRIGRKDHFHVSALHLHQLLNVGKAEAG
jgi:hypothetical protein